MKKSDNLASLAKALVAAQKNMGAALKDSKNPFFKSKYADLNAIIDASIPALNEQGIAVLQSPGVVMDGVGGSVSVINTILLHESGEFISGESKVVAAKINDPQAEGSATTYARRYGLQAMVTLKAEDDDGEAAMGRTTQAKTEPKQTTAQVTKPAATKEEKVVEAVKEEKTVSTPTTTAAPKKVSSWGDKKTTAKTETKSEGAEY